MVKNIISILAFLLLSVLANGQDFKADMQKVYEYYSGGIDFHTSMDVRAYQNRNDKQPYMVYKANIYKQGQNYHYTINDTEMLLTDKSLLMVYHDRKSMVYNVVDEKLKSSTKGNMLSTTALDSLALMADSVQFLGIVNQVKNYRIYTNGSMIQKTEISFDVNSGGLKRVNYLYNPILASSIYSIEIDFINLPLSEGKTDLFNMSKYITIAGKTVRPSASFITYDLSIVTNEK